MTGSGSASPYLLGGTGTGGGPGYHALCNDGTWTDSGGIQGACSHHGGLAYPELVPDVDGYDPNNDAGRPTTGAVRRGMATATAFGVRGSSGPERGTAR